MRRHKYSDIEPLRDPATGKFNPDEVKRRVKGWLAVLLAVAVLGGGAGFVALKGYDIYTGLKTEKDFAGAPGEEVTVVIPKNSSGLAVGKLLVDAGVVKDAKKFQDTASMRPDLWGKVQAGKYKLNKNLSSTTALQYLADPTRAIRVWVQLREGLRIDPQILQTLSTGTKLPVADLADYLTKTSPASAGVPVWATPPADTKGLVAFEGLLFPDKYEVPDGVTPAIIVREMTAEFTAVTEKLDFYNAAQAIDFGPLYKNASPAQKAYMAVIVASIIEKEVSLPEDRPKVARVLYNRLAKNMALQLDSTVAYSINKTGSIWTTDAERGAGNKSAYNTYQKPGLPPTPVSAPGEAALTAAINPEPGTWLYWVPQNLDTGETAFTNTLAEHNAATAAFKAWCGQPENKGKCP